MIQKVYNYHNNMCLNREIDKRQSVSITMSPILLYNDNNEYKGNDVLLLKSIKKKKEVNFTQY